MGDGGYANSLLIFSETACGLVARALSGEAAKGEKRGRQSRAFSHARGLLRVSNVLLDGPRKKRDCSKSICQGALNINDSTVVIIFVVCCLS